jgi:hypothetical protein
LLQLNLDFAKMKELDVRHLVFIDETWATTNMTRRYGRSPSGRRLVDKVPHGHWMSAFDDRCGDSVEFRRIIFEVGALDNDDYSIGSRISCRTQLASCTVIW